MASLSAAVNFEHGDGDEDYLLNGNESYATNHRHIQELQRLSAFQQVTTKVPPSYDGRSSWFAYEDAIDDWCDITELDGDKRGPALRNRLEGEAAIHKRLLDRERLKDPNKRSEVLQELPATSLCEGRSQCVPLPLPAVHELRQRGHASLDYQVSALSSENARSVERHLSADHGPYERRSSSIHRRSTSRRTRNHHERRGDGKSQ